jgi:endonuclease YncB( thermonuclease family)
MKCIRLLGTFIVKGNFSLKKKLFILIKLHSKHFLLLGSLVVLLLLTSCTLENGTKNETTQTFYQDSPMVGIGKEELEQLANHFNLEVVTVERVVDGDTLKLTDGRRVRLIGVNTPESTKRTEEYGKEASQYTTSKLNGKQVWIQKDISETDRYDRLLRIVWLAIPTDDMDENEIRTKMFNADLVINGYAEPSTFQPDVKYSDYFIKFAGEAREQNTGLWAYGENGTTRGDLD